MHPLYRIPRRPDSPRVRLTQTRPISKVETTSYTLQFERRTELWVWRWASRHVIARLAVNVDVGSKGLSVLVNVYLDMRIL